MKSRARIVTLVFVLLATLVIWRALRGGARPEPVRFAPAPEEPFGDGGTLTDAWADYDGDGDPDRFVGFNGEASRLYRNDRDDGFADVAGDLGLRVERSVRTSAWGDFDADGDPDLLLGYAGDAPVTALWRNDGADGFTDVAAAMGVMLASGVTRQGTWVDYDGDGDLDLFLAMRDGANRLFRNDGTLFHDVTQPSGIGDPRRSVGAVWLDIDTDGDLDAYVANMNGDANGLWVNEGGRFTDQAATWGLADGGRALGDETQGTVRPCAVDFQRSVPEPRRAWSVGQRRRSARPGRRGPIRHVCVGRLRPRRVGGSLRQRNRDGGAELPGLAAAQAGRSVRGRDAAGASRGSGPRSQLGRLRSGR